MLDPPADDDSIISLTTYINNIDYLRLNVKNIAVESIKDFSGVITNRQSQVKSRYVAFFVGWFKNNAVDIYS